MERDRRQITCIRCKQPRVSYRTHLGLCLPCSSEHRVEGGRATAQVTKAIARGELPRQSTCICSDCGKTASQYDHRDYLQPLVVEPVCRSCNQKRGVAFDSVYRPERQVA